MNKLIFANSKNGHMFYATGIWVSDPFFYFNNGKERLVFLDSREIGMFEGKKLNQKLKFVQADSLTERLKESTKENLALSIIKKWGKPKDKIKVPRDFPLSLADFLRQNGVEVEAKHPFFESREKKKSWEVENIQQSIEKNNQAFDLVENILREAIIKKGAIIFQDKVLTSEFLKVEVEKLFLSNDMEIPEGIIISSGKHTAIPHHQGDGEIKPNVPIICDIFPRSKKTGYFADMTRTFVKGKPNKTFLEMFDFVKKTQELAMKSVKAGITGKQIHQQCIRKFLSSGYHVGFEKGFVHGTGHGFGVEIHEMPKVNNSNDEALESGNVITIEPGLYYPRWGGARIEDDLLVTKDGANVLTNYHKNLVIK